MQALVTNDYRRGNQWPSAAEDEEDGYPLSVHASSYLGLPLIRCFSARWS